MNDLIQRLIEHPAVSAEPPAGRKSIETVKSLLGVELPPMLVNLWQVAGRIRMETLRADILGPDEICEFHAEGGPELFRELGIMAFVDDNESNYLGILTSPPLAFRIAFVPHDDSIRLVYRDVESCLLSLYQAVNQEEPDRTFFHDVLGNYAPTAPRSEVDRNAARSLFKVGAEHTEWCFAIQLLDEQDVDQWKRVLETEHFIRRDALARLKRLSSPAIRQLLDQDAEMFNQFAQLVAKSMREAGLKVGDRRDSVLQIEGKWYELENFFYRRQIPNAMPRLVHWVQDQLAKKHPYQRPGNFMED